jgi:hypothetical protein
MCSYIEEAKLIWKKVRNLGTLKCHVTVDTKEIRQNCYFRPCTVPRLRWDSGLQEI